MAINYCFKLYINKVLHLFEVMRIKVKEKTVFLTFDDGPEPGITEFILQELNKYNYKATFFCRGDNAKENPQLLSNIIKEGHALGNHTFNHISSFETPTKFYVDDVEQADQVLHTHLFRPPWGCITLPAFLIIAKKYKVVYWSLISGDTELKDFDLEKNRKILFHETKPGDIVLFHCCKRHEKETRQILPIYLEWLHKQGYKSNIID